MNSNSQPFRSLIEYDDFAIRFEVDPEEPGQYRTWVLPIVAESSASSFDERPFAPQQQLGLMGALALSPGVTRDTRRLAPVGEEIAPEDYGSRLFGALFHHHLGDAFDRARQQAEENGKGLRLRLVVDPTLGETALRLLRLPWELLYDRRREELLCQNPRMALVRHLSSPAHPSPRLDLLEGSMRVLVVASAPRDLPSLDTAADAQRLQEVLARRKRLTLRSVEPPTLAGFRRDLLDFDPHVIHFAGHGAFDPQRGGAFCFQTEDGDVDAVPFELLAEALAGARSLRLAVLNACDSSRVPAACVSAHSALALLFRLPAVIAMQFPIRDEAAVAFAGELYDALSAGDPLEAAMAEGRQAILSSLASRETVIPTLYLRRDDGELFRRIDRSDLAQWLHPQDDLVGGLTQQFVGRSFVFEKIAFFLGNDTKRGYFILRGDPGIGKSALLAEWIRRQDAVYHFNIRNDDHSNRSRHFLGNVCAQLILRFRLPYTTLPDDALTGPRFLEQLLREISEQRLEEGERLVIAVDALDEVADDETSRGGNLLHLPPRLPENVFFVLTTRRPPRNQQAPRLRFDVPTEQYDLEHDSGENRADVRAFIEAQEERYSQGTDGGPSLESWWRERGLDKECFVDLLTERSEGNFRYLVHVVPEIAKGNYRYESTDSLPRGLANYYDDHWGRLRELCGDDWKTYQLPVLGAMTLVERPLELELVCYLTEIESAVDVLAVLLAWDAFLHVRRHVSGKIQLQTYRFYHSTFIEFLEHQPEVDLTASALKMKERLLADFEKYDVPPVNVEERKHETG